MDIAKAFKGHCQKERMIKFLFQNTNPYLFSNFLRQMELNRKENKELLISTII